MMHEQLSKALSGTTMKNRYTFDTFVVGKINESAFAAARTVARHIGKKHNPLLLYGSSGLGKTHLLQAVANEVRLRNGRIRIINISENMLINDLIRAVGTRTTEEMRRAYMGAELFLVDNVRFAEGKQQTQKEFFHILNTLCSTGCQIVLASDRPPKDMTLLDERLRMWLEGGTIAGIAKPDYETRLTIVQKLVSERGVFLKEGDCEAIANFASENIRQLEGVVAKLGALQALSPRPISDDVVKTWVELQSMGGQ